jgi:hypothetical protein
MFRGAELSRLMTGILMLFVLYMMIVRAKDASTWRWLTKEDSNAIEASIETPKEASKETAAETAKKQPVKPERTLPEATGPTDEDPDQAEEARMEYQAVTDGTLQIQREEMEPYDRMIEWVKNQPYALLQHRATKGLRYTDFYDDAEKRRGELTTLQVDIRMAHQAGKNRFEVPLHEVWAATDESRGRLYSLIIVDYPKEMPVGFNINAKAKFVGYFLKLQGYEPASAKPGQKPEKAPLLIGRLEWIPSVVAAPPIDTHTEWTWGLSILAVLAVGWLVRWVYLRYRPKPAMIRSSLPEITDGEVVPIEEWLEHADFAVDDEEENVETKEAAGAGTTPDKE